MEMLWQHAMGCAIGSQWLAKQLHFDLLRNEAYTAGLLHDIGKVLIVTVVETLVQSGKAKLRPSNELLNEVIENFHSEYGYLLLKNWNLPSSYCLVAKAHHLDEIDPNDILLIMVRLVNHTCNKLGIGLKKDPSIILAATQEASLLGVSEVLLAQLEITLEDALIFNHNNPA
jgi:HD-like signal output (HDOD) protein